MHALSAGLVIIWLVLGLVAAAIGHLAGSYDRPMPWTMVVPIGVVGAVAGGLIGLAIDDRVGAGTAGAGIGAGALIALSVILAVQRSKQHQ
jgi:uncharacterized membrane protein YeaQ/YmgE (transglycosylase-associated protein family)